MGPSIALIQLTLRVEREAEAERQRYMAYRVDHADEKPVPAIQRDIRVKPIMIPLCRQQRCESI